MATMAMPQVGGANLNPTGMNATGGTTQPTTNPFQFGTPTGSPGNYGYGSSANPMPTATSTTPGAGPNTTTGLNPGGGDPTISTNPNTFMASGAGYNSAITQQAVSAQTAEMQLQANQNYGNLQSGLGAAGINPNSSAAALENSNFWSQTNTAENAMTAQEYFNMWQTSMQDETQLMSQKMADTPNALDWAGLGIDVGAMALGI